MLEISPHPMQKLTLRRDSSAIIGTISSVITPVFMDGKVYEVMLDIVEDAANFYAEGEPGVATEFMVHAQNLALSNLPRRRPPDEERLRQSPNKR